MNYMTIVPPLPRFQSEKLFDHGYNQLMIAALSTRVDQRDPLCACFRTDEINLLSAGGRPNSLISTPFPLSPIFFLNSHNTRAVHRALASRRTVDTIAHARVYEATAAARRYLALGGNERGGAGSRLLFGENYTRTAKHIHLRFVSRGWRSTGGANKSRANKTRFPRRGPRAAAGNSISVVIPISALESKYWNPTPRHVPRVSKYACAFN